MVQRIAAVAVIVSAAFGGMTAGWYLADGNEPPAPENGVHSITGVTSGNTGSDAEEPPQEGVEQIPPVEPPPTTTATMNVPENTIQGVNTEDGVFQSIRGIEGIDNVPLQNLEAVLRMQQPPPETPPQGGGARAAAKLLTMEPQETTELQPIEDGREDMTEFELEGS